MDTISKLGLSFTALSASVPEWQRKKLHALYRNNALTENCAACATSGDVVRATNGPASICILDRQEQKHKQHRDRRTQSTATIFH